MEMDQTRFNLPHMIMHIQGRGENRYTIKYKWKHSLTLIGQLRKKIKVY
jgi:hypothetical protein